MADENSTEMTDEEAIQKIAMAMKDNAPAQDEKVNIHTFLRDVVVAEDVTRVGNLRDDKDMNELGLSTHTVRGNKEIALIAKTIMNNKFFEEYFENKAQITLATSLSRAGFLVRQASTTTKQISDSTRRRKINKGWFGKQNIEESGGDITTQ